VHPGACKSQGSLRMKVRCLSSGQLSNFSGSPLIPGQPWGYLHLSLLFPHPQDFPSLALSFSRFRDTYSLKKKKYLFSFSTCPYAEDLSSFLQCLSTCTEPSFTYPSLVQMQRTFLHSSFTCPFAEDLPKWSCATWEHTQWCPLAHATALALSATATSAPATSAPLSRARQAGTCHVSGRQAGARPLPLPLPLLRFRVPG